MVGSATREIGIDRLADLLVEIGPSPLDRTTTVRAGQGDGAQEVEVAADPAGDPLAFVFKTIADPYVGQVSIFRVVSGTIRPDEHLVVSRTGEEVRLHGLLAVRGKEQTPVGELVAGDIGAVTKLGGVLTGDTLAPRGTPVVVPPIEQPEPTLAVAVVPRTQADEDKLAIIRALQEAGVTVHGDVDELEAFGASDIVEADDTDWGDEYLSMDIAAKVVDGVEGAIAHISRWSTGHTEGIATNNIVTAQKFADEVDAAAVMVNASTAFTDGEQYGMGAEIGISTQKLHARGPMALPELTSTKWILQGTGQTRP